MAYIYMVRCQDRSLYTGITQDIGRRMQEHYYRKKSGAKYTKSRQITALEMVWETDTWSGAARLEYWIKQLRKQQKEELILHPERVEEMLGEKAEGMVYRFHADWKLADFVETEQEKGPQQASEDAEPACSPDDQSIQK